MSETDREPYVGRPLKRTEDPKLITGRGQYVEDITLPALAHLAFLRSPHAHARVTALRTDAARKAPGVVRVVTAEDLGPLRPLPFMATIPGLKQARCPYRADAVVDSTGVPVAAVVAESASLARDAADLIEVEYQPLPPVADPERGLEPGARLAHAELGTNQAFSWPLKGGDVDGAFGRAAHVVKVRLDHNRLAGAPMEPRGVLARYDPGSDELTLWLTTQNPFLSRADLAAVLGFPEHKLRVIAPDVGGGLGVKGPPYREEIVAATLSRQLGRPVRWMSTRTEDLLTTIQARAAVSEAEGAVTADGEVIGLRAKAVFDLGAHLLSLSLVPPMSHSTHIFGPYRIQNAELLSVGVYTNTAPTGPYRGSGRPVGVYLIERLMDEAARATNLDPVEIRRRNFVAPEAFPHRTPFGVAYDDVIVRHGDTLGAPQAIGTFGSRSAGLGGSALAQAAVEIREKGRRLAARLLEASPEDVQLARGGFQVKGVPEKIVGWDRVGEFAHRGMGLPPGESPGLEATVFFRQDQPSWSFCAGIALVRIDRDTGHVRLERFVAVDDCGNAINPLLVDGQIVGALAQGIGQAMTEHVVYGEAGELLTANFMEYAIPRADDMPELALDRTVTPSPLNPLGVKGVGEGGACVAPPAIVNAVIDALSPFGVTHVDSPLTAEKIWRMIRGT